MLTNTEKERMVSSISIPEIRNSLQRLLDSMDTDPEAEGQYRLTILALLGFYRKNMQAPLSIETDHSMLKSRIISNGTLFFGPLYNPGDKPEVPRSKRLAALGELGMCTEHLVFLNPTQVELLFTYLRETGLVHDRH